MVGIIMVLLSCFKSCLAIQKINDTLPSKSHLVLPEIQIKGNALVAKRRGDTLVFAADRYKSSAAFRLEHLLSNIPGFRVDANGIISFNGRAIQRLLIDGDDLAAENYQLISRNLRSLLIDSIQVLEKYHENRLLKNFQGTNDVAVNLVLKKSYYGKSSINLIAAYAPKRYGEIQSELIRLNQFSKQFFVFNANNIGSRSLQNQALVQSSTTNKQQIMFRSWPDILHNTMPALLESKYVNQNGDWGVGVANSVKLNKYNQLRVNLRNSVYLASTIFTQYSQFASVLNNPIVLYTNQTDQRKWNETSLLLHIETDKGAKKKSTYELEGYTEYDTDKLNEVRQLTKKYYLNSTAHLNAKGFRLFMNHTWKTSVNHVWYWETILNSSANKNNILLARNDFLYFDSTANKLNQFIYHRAIYGQISIGHIRSFKKNIIRYWIKSSVTQLLSCQYQNSLDLIITKNYLSTHLTRSLTKKINFDIQSMLGYTQMFYNKKPQNGLIYQFDQAINWKPKATRQLSLNLGLIKQETEAKKFFAGPFYANATTQIVAPSVVIFPVMFFGQLNFSLFDLYRGVNLYAQLMIKKMNRDYFMATTVYPDYTVISQPIGERQFLSSFNMHFEKVLHVIRMKYRISFSAKHLYSPAQFNGEKFMAINDVLNFGQYLSTNWQKGYNFQLEYKKINSKSIGLSNSRFKNFIHDYKAVVQLQLNSQLNGQLSIQHYNGKDVIPFNLFDMKMNWLLKSKYRIFIEGINLLHNRTFIQQTLSSSSITVTHQHVLGRRIIFGADIPF